MTKWDDIYKRAEIVWRDPNYFKNFEVEEVGVLTDLFVPNMVVVSYILWGTRYNGRREKCCKYTERVKIEPDNHNGI